jgi:hypothetical protein
VAEEQSVATKGAQAEPDRETLVRVGVVALEGGVLPKSRFAGAIEEIARLGIVERGALELRSQGDAPGSGSLRLASLSLSPEGISLRSCPRLGGAVGLTDVDGYRLDERRRCGKNK